MINTDDIGPALLRALTAIAEAGSFTGAAASLGLRQSTVSQQIKRLEMLSRRRLLDRTTHRVVLTPDGEALLDHARRILDQHNRLHRHLGATSLRGRLRFGASEDFVLSALPDVLAAFMRRFPEVDVELTAALSEPLYQAYDAGDLDIVLVKKRPSDARGIVAWREPVAWVGSGDIRLDPAEPLPLLLYPPPSVTRCLALQTLDAARREWRVAFTSGSLSGLRAAGRAGIGIMPHSPRLMPPGLSVVPASQHLPALPEVAFAIIHPGGGNPVHQALAETILAWVHAGSQPVAKGW
ncbi:MAG: LysR substrate-binding domain-containing protein [Sphingobium sp.]